MTDSTELQRGQTPFERLTPREKEALRRTAAGETAKEIGRAMGISHRTVHNYQQEAARKIGVTGSVRAARLLLEHEAQGGVHLHPASEVVAQPPENTLSPVLPGLPPADAATDVKIVGTIGQGVVPAGRMIQTSTAQVLRDVLAWGLGVSLIAVSAAEIYRISL